MATMNALRAHARGGPETLTYEHADVPVPAADEVQIEVSAAAITFDELLWDETWLRDGNDRTPIIPSHEFAGVISAVGSAVTDLAPGDRVYGMVPFNRDGAAAQYVVTPADQVAPAPASLSSIEAAALPLAGLTAWQALTEHAKLQPGETVLVLGGVGGVGAFATQIAKQLGAEVTVTVKSSGVELARSLGADHIVDVTAGDAPTTGVFDVVIDTVGGAALEQAYSLARRGGRLVTLQMPPSQDKAARAGIDAVFFVVTANRAGLATLASLADTAALRVLVAATFPLAEGRTAYESGHASGRRPGKTVLTVKEQS